MRIYINYCLIIIVLLLIVACSNGKGGNLLDDPKELAKITLKIVDIGNNNKKLSQLFEGIGYNLANGSKKYIEVHNNIKKDQEQYKIFRGELARLVKQKALEK